MYSKMNKTAPSSSKSRFKKKKKSQVNFATQLQKSSSFQNLVFALLQSNNDQLVFCASRAILV